MKENEFQKQIDFRMINNDWCHDMSQSIYKRYNHLKNQRMIIKASLVSVSMFFLIILSDYISNLFFEKYLYYNYIFKLVYN